MKLNIKKIIYSFALLIGLFSYNLATAQINELLNISPSEIPEGIPNLKNVSGEELSQEIFETLKSEAIPVWEKVLNWLDLKVWQPIKTWVLSQFQPQVIEQEYSKEKEEMKSELPEAKKTLWEKFKELF